MVETKELPTIADLWNAAEAKLVETETSVSDPDLSTGDDQAEDSEEEAAVVEGQQSESVQTVDAEGEDVGALLDILAEDAESEGEDGEEGPPPPITADMDALWGTEVDVVLGDGPHKVKLSELRDGFMMRADYTQKTQKLADERRAFETDSASAKELWDKFQADPQGVARFLAIEAGWIEPDGSPVHTVEVAKLRTQEDVEAEVQRQVEERLAEHPSIQAAQVAAAQQAVDQDFANIEAKYEITLSDSQRQSILQEAVQRGVADLEVVLEAQLGRARQKQAERVAAVDRAPARGGHASTSVEEPEVKKPTTILEAIEAAEAKTGLRLGG